MQQQRRLAAIMFTDMVGYSSLTQEDEAFALELLAEHRSILRPFFPMHGGHEVEVIGDAFFVEFSSALEAVLCAIDIQKELWSRNKDLPSKQQIRIRIGIHLGDVVPSGENVLGDGVNIAARIEPLSQSCGICVSEDVARQVQNKIEFPLEKIETTRLKGISLPVEVYSVVLNWLEEDPKLRRKKRRKRFFVSFVILVSTIALVFFGLQVPEWLRVNKAHQNENLQWQNSIAVLPFTDLSPGNDQEYFCDGMTEQILTNLAQLNSLKVIARTSVMKFKDTEKTIPEIAKELNVENILEGSIRKFDKRLRVTAQLVRARDGSHIWAGDYDREYSELFTIQDEISKSIADTLLEKLSKKEIVGIKTKRTVNLEAYENYLKAEHLHQNKYWSGYLLTDFKEAEQLFLKAIELDSDYAASYAGLVDLYNTYWNTQDLSPKEKRKYLNLQEKYINRAYEIDPESADVNRVMGWVYGAKRENDKKFECMKKAVRLDPNDPENSRALGICYDNIGLKNLAFKCYSQCINLDPYDTKYYYYHANIHLHLGQFHKAKSGFEKTLSLEPNDPKYLMRYIWLLFQIGEITEAERRFFIYKQLYPGTGESKFLQAVLFAHKGEKEKALKIELSEENRRIIYLLLKMKKESLSALESMQKMNLSIERSDYLLLKYHPLFDFLRSDPEFKKIVSTQKDIYDENWRKYGETHI